MASDQKAAQQRWELENDVQRVDAGDDAYYKYDHASQQALQQQKPWTKDPHYFKQCVPCFWSPAACIRCLVTRANHAGAARRHSPGTKAFPYGSLLCACACLQAYAAWRKPRALHALW